MHAYEWKLCRKVENEKNSMHTHKIQDILSRKPFWVKTEVEGEAISLSFSIWKYVMKPAHKKIEKRDKQLSIQPLRGGNLLYIIQMKIPPFYI